MERLDELCRRAQGAWGIAFQETRCIEECAELIEVLAKLHRLKNGRGPQHLAEEIADVELMCHQLKLAYELRAVVEEIKRIKLERLEAQLEAQD